jgi:prepilin-type N-terminal cleavage/methylation domain-containing protein
MKSLCNKYEQGFTLLELLAVLAIIATVSLFGLPAIQEWNAKKSFGKSVNEFYSGLSRARLEALEKNTVTKIVTTRNSDTYTVISYNNSSASAACNAAGGWTQIESMTVNMNSNFEVTGSGIGTVCFYRDGTSSGGIYNIAQKNGQTNLGNASINVILATGFIDVTKN